MTEWLTSVVAAVSGGLNPWDDRYYTSMQEAGVATSAGLLISPEQALRIITVFDCVRVISETVAALPILAVQRLKDGERKELPDHPVRKLIRTRPNEWQTGQEFLEMVTGHCVLRGNGYVYEEWDSNGVLQAMYPLHPAYMQVAQDPATKRLRYQYRLPNQQPVTYSQESILHLRFMTNDGVVGMNPIMLAREAMGLAAAAEAYGARIFGSAARPAGILTHPAKLSPEARNRLRKEWDGMHAGPENWLKTAVLEEGLTWAKVGIDPKDAQFLELRQYQRAELASLFRVPPPKVGIMEGVNYNGAEQLAIEFVTDCIVPWVTRWERTLQRDAIVEEDVEIKFNVAGLLRGDLKSRYDAYAVGRTNGWLSANEIRAFEDMNAREGGDEFLDGPPAGGAPAPDGQQGGKRDPGLPQPKPSRTPKAEEAVQPLQAVWDLALDDAAQRITAREVREIGVIVARHKDKDRRERLEAFFKDHEEYVARALLPVVAPFGRLPEVLAKELVVQGTSAWEAGALLPSWQVERTRDIVAFVRRTTRGN